MYIATNTAWDLVMTLSHDLEKTPSDLGVYYDSNVTFCIGLIKSENICNLYVVLIFECNFIGIVEFFRLVWLAIRDVTVIGTFLGKVQKGRSGKEWQIQIKEFIEKIASCV